MSVTPRVRRYAAGVSLVAAGLVGGGAMASAVSANAADSTTGTAATAASGSASSAARDESRSVRPDETLLTGTKASKARAAALVKYPGATIQRVETDSDGVYEAHIVTTGGLSLIVQMDADFAVTGTDQHGGPGPR